MIPSRLLLPSLAVAALLPGCATPRIPSDVSQAVIDSLIRSHSEPPWRLGVAWLSGGMGGAAVRSAGIEHVVHKKSLPVSVAATEAAPLLASPSSSYSDDEVERAWRKFCRNRLDMTERDRQIIQDTPVPGWAFGNCHTANLLK
jgi:hypothetical protein